MNFANGAQSTLSAGITAGATSLTVANGAVYPAAPFHLCVDTELMTCTAILGGLLTVTRGIEGTTAAAHAAGALVTNTVTAGDFAGFAGGVAYYDMLSLLVNTPVVVTNADANITAAAWNVAVLTTGAHTFTLPAPTAKTLIGIRVDPSSTYLLTVSQHATDLIDGAATRIMWAGEKAVLLADGTNWFKVAGQSIPMTAHARCTTNPTIHSSTVTLINCDTLVFDNTGLIFDSINGALKILRPGYYSGRASVQWQNILACPNAGAQLQKNDATNPNTLAATLTGDQHNNSYRVQQAGAVASLVTGDKLYCAGYQDTGADQTIYVGNPSNWVEFIEQPTW